jgi:hypothetical protein
MNKEQNDEDSCLLRPDAAPVVDGGTSRIVSLKVGYHVEHQAASKDVKDNARRTGEV